MLIGCRKIAFLQAATIGNLLAGFCDRFNIAVEPYPEKVGVGDCIPTLLLAAQFPFIDRFARLISFPNQLPFMNLKSDIGVCKCCVDLLEGCVVCGLCGLHMLVVIISTLLTASFVHNLGHVSASR